MKLVRVAITAAVVAGLSGPALAQEGSGSGQPVTNPPANTNPHQNQNPLQGSGYNNDTNHNWVVSGFIGTNFGASRVNTNVNLDVLEHFDTSTTSANFGGQVAYLAGGHFGGEFLADFSPSTSTFNNVLFENKPFLSSYMINAIAVAPFGYAKTVDPYISGGIGWVNLHATIFTVDPTLANVNAIGTESVSGSRFGWDLGGGIMAWSEKSWGFRGDVRYYRTNNSNDVFDVNNIGDGTVFTRVELSDVSFWKANAGVSFRW
jgi:hypothetical protein